MSKHNELWEQAKADTLVSLYKNDPLIRQSLDAQMNRETPKAKPSIVLRDEQGRVTGVEGGSVLSGRHATVKAQTELWNALMEEATNPNNNKKEEDNNGF